VGLLTARCRAEPLTGEHGGDAPGGNRITHRSEFRPAILDVLDRDVGEDDVLGVFTETCQK
jgi:hypothetical protein